MLLIAAPGQGAQTPGFLAPWLELPGVDDRIAAWSDLAGCDLIAAGTTGSAEEIRDTAVAQPLLVAAALAAVKALAPEGHALVLDGAAAAGHSVGELAAGAIARIVTPEDALVLVGVRGRAMAQAAAATATSMTAVLGGAEPDVLAAIDECGLTPANINGAGQIVAAGTVEQLAAFAASPPPGARLRSLAVAGAFHTSHMGPAVGALREAAARITPRDPAMIVLSNRDGAIVRTGTDWIERIVTQVSAPVRWDACMATMSSLGVTAFLELPPAGTLAGLARRALPGVEVLAMKTPDDLGAARDLLATHADGHFDSLGETHTDTHAPEWRLLVAPSAGTFRSPEPPGGPGQAVDTGTSLGRVEMRGASHLVAAAFPATIIEWLVEDGDPVSPGQPLVRLQPERQ
jgi:[acyl-carrier-protein] S-malonyltransferase